jgi:hypothetical protein
MHTPSLITNTRDIISCFGMLSRCIPSTWCISWSLLFWVILCKLNVLSSFIISVFLIRFLTYNPPYSKEILFLFFHVYVISQLQSYIYVSLSLFRRCKLKGIKEQESLILTVPKFNFIKNTYEELVISRSWLRVCNTIILRSRRKLRSGEKI